MEMEEGAGLLNIQHCLSVLLLRRITQLASPVHLPASNWVYTCHDKTDLGQSHFSGEFIVSLLRSGRVEDPIAAKQAWGALE